MILIAPLWLRKNGLLAFFSSGGHLSLASDAVKSTSSASCTEVSQRSVVAKASCLETIKQLSERQAFLKRLGMLLLQTSDPCHASSRDSGTDSFIGVVEGMLL